MTTSDYQPTEEEKLFRGYYENLISEIIYARAHLQLWERLKNYTASDYIDELNCAPFFFQLTMKSHFDDALLTLSRILDQHEDSLSIWKFLNFAEQNLGIFSTQAFQRRMMHRPDWFESHTPMKLEEIQEHRLTLYNSKQVIDNIKKWRDKRLAHFDRELHIKGRVGCPQF